jgi:hypothetical protein
MRTSQIESLQPLFFEREKEPMPMTFNRIGFYAHEGYGML